jgi:glutamate 5-kinase
MPSLAIARRAVVKIGSALVVDERAAAPRAEWLAGIALDIATLKARGTEVIVVSSGAIALARRALGMTKRQLKLEEKQAAAAVGQIRLAQAWAAALSARDLTAAQLLLTLDDTEDRRRYLNARATLNVLVLLSDIDGLYTADPRGDPAAEHLPFVSSLTPEIEAMAGDPPPGYSSGGMRTKLIAARIATQAGVAMAIARGNLERPLRALENGARCTWFLPAADGPSAWKRWIGGALTQQGVLIVDAGAAKALRDGRSLLPAGVRSVEGTFQRGDPVLVLEPSGEALAKGLSAYASEDAARIAGHRSDKIEAILGWRGRDEMIHRDDLVVLDVNER